MDLVSSCKEKLLHFRIKELKDVLTQLGCSKQGKKQDLVDRILSVLCDERGSSTWSKKNAVGKEEVTRLVDDIYRKLPVTGATDLASKSQAASDNGTKLKEEVEDTFQRVNIRCPCGSSLQTDSMIKCEDPKCNVWQHIGCVLIPDKPTDGVIPATPDIFYCEICRLNRGDPFLVSVGHPLNSVKLISATITTDGTNPKQNVEKTFQLNRSEKDLLLKQEYDVQAWCMLLNDKVPFRMHWPQAAELFVNDVSVKVIHRPATQLLGTNGRDEGPTITKYTKDGINKISLTRCDSRVFCLGIRLVRRRTFEQIFSMIPKESVGEKFEDALARVRRCIGGGGNVTGKADDSDSDLEVVADCIPVSLRCPMSASRMKVAGRFKPCLHMGCFDLEVFLRMNERSRKWQCPNCLKNYALENLIIDPYFNCITSKMRNSGEDISEIEVKPDGSWRAKPESDRRDLGELGLWHFADGSLCPANMEVKPKLEALKHVKQEGGGSDGRPGLKLGIRKNCNGSWKVSKQEAFENHPLNNIIPMSSSATGSGRDGEDASVNGGGNFEFSVNIGVELDSIPLNLENRFGFPNQNPSAPLRDQEVIVLSDSEEENDIIIPSSRNVYMNNSIEETGVSAGIFPVPHGIPDPFPEDDMGGTTGMGLLNSIDDEFGIWPLTTSQPGSSSFQLFSPEADVSNAMVGLQHGSISCPAMMNDFNLNPETDIGPTAALAHESTIDDHSNADMNGGLVDNPLAFGGNDPALQIFLPTRPSADASSIQLDVRNQPEASTNIRSSEDWISLRVGDSGNDINHDESGIPNGLSSQQQHHHHQQLQTKEGGALSCLADSASLLLSMNDKRISKTARERSDSPFTFPRQKRSVRPRLYLSIETDSDSE